MVSIVQVGAYLVNNHSYSIKEKNRMSQTKLQKLSYYSQAWHYVWAGELLTEDDFEAWQFGPVAPALYYFVRDNGWSFLARHNFDAITEDEKESIDIVVNKYGILNATELTELSHNELPWLATRKTLLPHERSKAVIDKELIYSYHESQLDEYS